jgi:hypothetical protein
MRLRIASRGRLPQRSNHPAPVVIVDDVAAPLLARLLAICENCPKWDRHGCHRIDVRPGVFAVWLCDAAKCCKRWG